MDKTKIIRELGSTEKICWIRSKIAPFNVQVTLKVNGPLTKSLFFTSMDAIIQKQAFLRVSISELNGRYFWVKTENSLLYRIIDIDEKVDVKLIMEEELNFLFVLSKAPLGRICWIKRSNSMHYLIFSINHTIGDGLSVFSLGCSFIKKCSDFHNGIKVDCHPFELKLPIENYLPPYSLGKPYSERAECPQKNKEMIINAKISQIESRRTLTLNKCLSEEQTKLLMQRVKSKTTSLPCLISAAFAIALFKKIKYENPSIYTYNIQVLIPVNFRPYSNTKLNDEELGNYTSRIMLNANVSSETEIWFLSNLLTKELKQQINSKKHAESIKEVSIKYAHIRKKVDFMNILPNKEPFITSSSLGLLNIESNFPFNLEKISFNTSLNTGSMINNYSFFSFFYTFKNRLHFDFNHIYPTYSAESLKKTVGHVIEILIRAIK